MGAPDTVGTVEVMLLILAVMAGLWAAYAVLVVGGRVVVQFVRGMAAAHRAGEWSLPWERRPSRHAAAVGAR